LDSNVTQGVEIPADVLNRNPSASNEPSDAVEDLLEVLARTRPDLNMLFEIMLDIDEGLQEWRYRHVQLVRRTIGDKSGTGGSPGVEYLKRTVYEPAFPDLWAIRARF
jgi:tryptophan 2,3-dioxygenase